MKQQFPRMVFRDGVSRIVADEAEHTQARREGWRRFGEDVEAVAEPAPAARRGRPPKVQ